MDNPQQNIPPTTKDATIKKDRIKGFIDTIDLLKKLLISILVIIFSIIILAFFIKNSFKKQLIVYPFKISASVQSKGYTPEILTTLLVDKIQNIQNIGNSFYHNSNIVIPSWDNKVDEYDVPLSNSLFGEVKGFLEYFGNRNSKKANGQIVLIDSIFKMQFSFDGHSISIDNVKDIDQLLSIAAENSLKYLDPYTLATYYLKINNYDQCLKITQQLLNDDDPNNDGLAMHLRGVSYLSKGDTATAKKIFLEALKTIKSPWLTENNLGVIYYFENNIDSSRRMLEDAIKLSPKTYPAYLNYANLLYKIYNEGLEKKDKNKLLDSCIYNYEKAISCKKDEINLYVALLPALSDKGNKVDFEECEEKILEMDSNNYLSYYQMALIMERMHKNNEAILFYEKTKLYLGTDSIKISQVDAKIQSLKK